MPNRILRASLRQSHRWNKCGFFDQVFYVRLLMLVDDYGRYEAHPQLLANECFPYGDPSGVPVTCQSIDKSLTVICSSGLARVYEVDGSKYIQLNRWKERVRTESKFPNPPNDSQMTVKCLSSDRQMLASPPSPSPSPSPTPTPTPAASVCDLETRISRLYSRGRESLNFHELGAVAEIALRPKIKEEMVAIEKFERALKSAGERNYFPQSASRLLSAWQETVDRAGTWTPKKTPQELRELKNRVNSW